MAERFGRRGQPWTAAGNQKLHELAVKGLAEKVLALKAIAGPR